ncbi:hypothetical protein D9M72_185860 [compost metagenome]
MPSMTSSLPVRSMVLRVASSLMVRSTILSTKGSLKSLPPIFSVSQYKALRV